VQFTREINRLLLALLAGFGVIALAALYWAIAGPDTILKRQDNPRGVENELRLLRGSISDRSGELLVISETGATGRAVRRYLYPATYSALGYASQRYGVSGAEQAFNQILRGDDLPRNLTTYLEQDLLHHPQTGSDVRLTLDLAIQQTAVEALGQNRGAVVVLAVPGGDVLALVSQPTFDPNRLDADWEILAANPGKPFFNRALQGRYQPGGALQTPLIAAALLTDSPMDDPIENAVQPVTIANTTISCAVRLPDRPLTLREAYVFACPAPFARLALDLGVNTVQAALDTFHLSKLPSLAGFILSEDPLVAPYAPLTSQNLVETALGQGSLKATPLEMAVLAASIVNDGSAPAPRTLLAVRPPGSADWQPSTTTAPPIPMTTANTARSMQDMMRLAVAAGAAQNAGRPDRDIGGHAALAYSGEEAVAWFVGFVTLGGKQAAAVAVVIENSADPGLAADIGGQILAAAHTRLQLP
jgi:peptidoglycan glycosyltransferase